MSTKVYRVTRTRKNPGFYKSAVSVKICNEKSLRAQLKYLEQVREHFYRYRDKYSLTEPSEDIVKIEAAEVGEFTDITQEVLKPWDNQQKQD